MNGDNTYLHGFTRDGRSVGQTGPYLTDQVSAIQQGHNALKRVGARRIVRVEAANPAAAAALAEGALRKSAGIAEEPWSARDRIRQAIALASLKTTVARARQAWPRQPRRLRQNRHRNKISGSAIFSERHHREQPAGNPV